MDEPAAEGEAVSGRPSGGKRARHSVELLTRDGLLIDQDKGSLSKWYLSAVRAQAMAFRNDNAPHPCPWARRVVKNTAFEFTVSLLIVLNCVFIGVQANFSASRPKQLPGMAAAERCGTPEEQVFCYLEHIFTACFFLDLLLQVIAQGWTFLFDKSNFVDVFLVVLSVLVGWVLVPLGFEVELLRKLTVLRTLRLVRLARAVRGRVEFKEMWSLLKGLVDSREMLVWTYVLIALLLYFFAIISTSVIGKTERWADDEETQVLFGDVPKSMLTLFQVMTLDSWSSLCRQFMKRSGSGVWIGGLLVVFISIAQFVLMNLITAVIIQNAFSDSKVDDTEAMEKEAMEREQEMHYLRGVFKSFDLDGNGTVNFEEIRIATKRPKVRKKLAAMEISAKDVLELWDILINDGEEELHVEEFINGLQRLRSDAQQKDVMRLQRELRILESSVDEMEVNLDKSQHKMNSVKASLKRAAVDVSGMHRTVAKALESIKHAALVQRQQPFSG